MLQGTGTAGGSFKRRPWLRMGCCADDDDDDNVYSPTRFGLESRQSSGTTRLRIW
jgi:hypothetical protein